MNDKQWKAFCTFREKFREKVTEWKDRIPDLADLQKNAALTAGTPEYPFENTVVYNTDLDKITKNDEIKLIVIGDNPGKDEQLNKNCRYLCGQAGKIADGFFRRNEQLGIDFRKNVIILNKTPVHSAKTAQLRKMMKDGGQAVSNLILESQLWMAEQTAAFHKVFVQTAEEEKDSLELWLVGYSELKDKGFFVPYRDELKKAYAENPRIWDKVFVFQHFSMNRFTIDLDEFVNKNKLTGLELMDQLHNIGEFHKKEIFGIIEEFR